MWVLAIIVVASAHADAKAKEYRVDQTLFQLPESVVDYYDRKGQSVLSLVFSLPDVVPLGPYSEDPAKHAPAKVVYAAIKKSSKIPLNIFEDRLEAEGMLRLTPYDCDLQQIDPTLIIGSDQKGENPGAREFIGMLDGQRVVIYCGGFRHSELLPRCKYDYAAPRYLVRLDIPYTFLCSWRKIMSKAVYYASSHEVK